MAERCRLGLGEVGTVDIPWILYIGGNIELHSFLVPFLINILFFGVRK